MFLLLVEYLISQGVNVGPFGVIIYPTFRIMIALATALAISVFANPWFIRQLISRQIGEVIRDDEDQVKAGTPTMGGILIIFSMVVSTLLWADITQPIIGIVLFITISYTVIGFIDDRLKLVKKNKVGLSELGKTVPQIIITFLAMLFLIYYEPIGFSREIFLPFISTDRFLLTLHPFIYVVLATIGIYFIGNSANLTDGLDGLLIGTALPSAVTYTLISYIAGTILIVPVVVNSPELAHSINELAVIDFSSYLMIPHVQSGPEIAIFSATLIGAGVGFLWYNAPPARVFMGDVGSLGIGGALAIIAVVSKTELVSFFILGIFVVEGLSVLIQRFYYRFTRRQTKDKKFGKRVFYRAPIHHHFQIATAINKKQRFVSNELAKFSNLQESEGTDSEKEKLEILTNESNLLRELNTVDKVAKWAVTLDQDGKTFIGRFEPKIVIRFWVIAILLNIIALASLKIR